jgi:hypothetical protein
VIKTKEDFLLSELFRGAYGPEYTWDSATDTLALRKGVGTIEDGPTIPKVKIPTGKVGNKMHKKANVPTAIAAVSVEPADMGFSDDFSGANVDDGAASRARARARAYIASKS